MMGFGTYRLHKDTAYSAVKSAVKEGYKNFDTAVLYRNEEFVGQALHDTGISRKEITITTKIPDNIQTEGRDAIFKTFEQSLKKLQTDYVDTLLLHAPMRDINVSVQAWLAMEELQKQQKVINIGISNFIDSDITTLLSKTSVKPSTNQIEVNPFLTREKLVTFCDGVGIPISAHTPLAKGEKFGSDVAQKCAEEHGITEAQVLLLWSLQKGYNVLPRSGVDKHITDNFSVLDMYNSNKRLTRQNMVDLDGLNVWYATHPKYLRDKDQ